MPYTDRPMNTASQRFCSECETILPLNLDNFYQRTMKGKVEFHYKCIPCMKEITKANSKRKREMIRERKLRTEKALCIRTSISKDLYQEAKELCGLTHEEIKQMIVDIGVSGLSNFVHDQHNWIED